ncbi:MAG TPA: DUF4124 domain-containing protein [Comamonadaceae bacterium]|uniref:DUF4124 domain-containing protein n=1 Tax=Pulveribacter sp. TaxID=2678893 RepID=UPI000EE45FF9|nr:DUF4124 domain-containing protein [Pulveribacter sp.]HCL86171.1 DUF4124 domain-containing protein [Comamonadaceae bacterium]
MKRKQLFLLALACTWALGASAQWQWVDKDGRKVFSDRPPPQDVPDKNILKQPTLRGTLPAAAPAAAASTAAQQDEAAPAAAAASAPSAGRDQQLEDKKAKAEAAEAARKQAEEKAQAERQAKARAENCARARQSSATLASGIPMAHVNAQGERGFMDEATRAAELRRAQAIMASDCK